MTAGERAKWPIVVAKLGANEKDSASLLAQP